MHRPYPDPTPGPRAGNERSVGRRLASPLLGLAILIVEDNPLIALDLQGTLEAAGATVIGPAHDLSQAVRLTEESRISAAILDYRLQYDTTLSLAAMLARHGIPFAFQTSDPASVAREYPDATIIAKPFNSKELISSVEALFQAR